MAKLLKNEFVPVKFDELCEVCVKRIVQKSLFFFCAENHKTNEWQFDFNKDYVAVFDGKNTENLHKMLVKHVKTRGFDRIVRVWRYRNMLHFKVYDKWTRETKKPC